MIAKTILQQLGGSKFLVMTGAKNLLDHGNALSMRISGNMTRNRINYVKITLDPSDTYTVEFGKVRGTKYTVVDSVDDVYCDKLREIFESKTGLLTSLGTCGR